MLGELSARYESNGDCGCISSGYNDAGGKSYGTYQLASAVGSVDEYINWLCDNNYWFGQELHKYEVGSEAFDNTWRWLAETNRAGFEQSQHDYIKSAYYDPAVALLASKGWHIENHSEVMKDVVWSRAVQYGIGDGSGANGGVDEMWDDAVHQMWNVNDGGYTGYPNLSYIDDARFDYDFIYAIYILACSSPEWNSSALRDSLNNRFADECNRALARL